MGTIIFSGSWLSFITFSVLWVIGVICTCIGLKEMHLKKYHLNQKQSRRVKLFVIVLQLMALVTLLVNNFQYTSHDTSAEVRGFDAPAETQVIEVKKIDRLSSSDVAENFKSTIQHAKQENSRNE